MIPDDKFHEDIAPSDVHRSVPWLAIYLAALATIITLVVVYYFVIALPSTQRQRIQLERDKFKAAEAERNSKKQAESAERFRLLIANQERERALSVCLDDAEKQYWEYIKLNGGKPIKGKAGAFTAPQWVWDEAEKRRKSDKDECYRRYGSK